MKTVIAALTAVAMFSAPQLASATGTSSKTSKTPGHEMHMKGSKKGSPGASGYAPGHEMHAKGSKAGQPGASGYAPGQTTGANTKRGY
jgi:hypothetical protein